MAKLKYSEFVEVGKWFEKEITSAKEMIAILTELKKTMSSVAKESGKELKSNKLTDSEDLKKYTKATSTAKKAVGELADVEERINKIHQKKKDVMLQLEAEQHDENKLLIEANELKKKQTRLTKDAIAMQNAERGSIKQLEAVNRILVERRKKLNLETDKGRKANERLTRAIKKNQDRLNSFNSAIGRHQGSVGNYGKALVKVRGNIMSLVGALGVTAGLAGALKIVNVVMKSTNELGDKFDRTIEGLGGALSFMATALANMDFSNIVNGMRDAYNEAQRYGGKLDEIGDRERALKIQVAEAEYKQAKILNSARENKYKDIKQAQADTDEYMRLEKEKLDKKLELDGIKLKNEIDNIKSIIRIQKEGHIIISEETIKHWIGHYNELIDIQKEGEKEYWALIENSKVKTQESLMGEDRWTMKFNQKKFVENYKLLDKEHKARISFALLDSQLNKEKRTKLQETLQAEFNSRRTSEQSQSKLIELRTTIWRQLRGEENKRKKEDLKEKRDLDKEDLALTNEMLKLNEEAEKSADKTRLENVTDRYEKEEIILRTHIRELIELQDEAKRKQVISEEEYYIRIRDIARYYNQELINIDNKKNAEIESNRDKALNRRITQEEEQYILDKEAEAKRKQLQQDLTLAIVDGVNYVSEAYRKQSELKLSLLAKELEASKRHEDTLKALAESRSESVTDNLAFEQKRQADIRAKELKEQKKQQRIALITSSINAFASKANSGDKDALSSTIKDITALMAFVSSLPAFKEGVIDFKGEGTGTSDSNIVRISKGESIMTAKETKMSKPLLQAIRDNDLNRLPSIDLKTTDVQRDNSMIEKLDEIKKTIANKPEYSYDIDQVADLITERVKKGNTMTINHYRKGGLC